MDAYYDVALTNCKVAEERSLFATAEGLALLLLDSRKDVQVVA